MKSIFRRKRTEDILAARDEHGSLHKVLSVRDLTALGIAAIVGAGIFSTIGTAASEGGPGVVFLFLFTAAACGLAAFCYAEFASMLPVSGSAYTYSYFAFGELMAWIIGWALIMEYAIGNITVAISWSDYFCGLLEGLGLKLPMWMQMDYLSARSGYLEAETLMRAGQDVAGLESGLRLAHEAYLSAPVIAGFHLVLDIPALLIIALITWLVYRGIRESRTASNLMVVIKIAVVILVIVVGAFYVNPDNWSPFAPNGVGGILRGVSAVFFAYIGFDAISTTAEECRDPQRDLPRSMMYAILICTVLYVLIALVLTGMVPYGDLAVGDPLAFVFSKLDMPWMSGIIAVSAIVAMASVFLVFQLGQPRIWFSMSRDGLLPPVFRKLHPRYKTPSFATIVAGVLVAVPALFLNLTTVTDLCSIGTLFAFALVCGGVLMIHGRADLPPAKFRTPYINSRWILPVLVLAGAGLIWRFEREATLAFFQNEPRVVGVSDLLSELDSIQLDQLGNHIMYYHPMQYKAAGATVPAYLQSIGQDESIALFKKLSLPHKLIYESAWESFSHRIPMWIFLLVLLGFTILAFWKKLSIIPVLGLLCCVYMMAQIPVHNWLGFGIWLVTGLVIYFGYGYRHSILARVRDV